MRSKAKRTKFQIAKEKGFSLIEATIAFTILLVALMGVFSTIISVVNYNTGNSLRSQSLAIMQQQAEILQSAKFSPTVTDQILTGGTKTPTIVKSADGNEFRVEIVVDDDPLTDGIQVNATKTLKEISVTVTPKNAFSSWQTAVAATVIFRRVRGN